MYSKWCHGLFFVLQAKIDDVGFHKFLGRMLQKKHKSGIWRELICGLSISN